MKDAEFHKLIDDVRRMKNEWYEIAGSEKYDLKLRRAAKRWIRVLERCGDLIHDCK